jgi:hypothetical protein
MGLFIDGIGTCQVLDKSSEIVDLKGLDISSLAKTGSFNWEHQNNTPATLVGKILKAKKIYTLSDCENEREKHFWNKCKAPYLYVMGELLDDYTASAKECAGQMRYSQDHPDKTPLLGFSIEGSEIPNTRKGVIITRSIARKVTLTAAPCNSLCTVEIYQGENHSQIKDEFEEIFKSESNAIELFKSGEGVKIYEDFLAKKEKDFEKGDISGSPAEPNQANAAAMQAGAMSGPTSFGSAMSNIASGLGFGKSEGGWSSGRVDGDSVHYNHPEHGTVSIQKQPTGEFHVKHQGKLAGVGGVKGSFPTSKEAGSHAKKYMQAVSQKKILAPKMQNISSDALLNNPLSKAIEAGSYNAAPSTLAGGAVYQSESLGNKKNWKKRARDDYENWSHREEFENFMKSRMPHLHEGEIRAIGRTLALKKNIKAENSLEKLFSKKK